MRSRGRTPWLPVLAALLIAACASQPPARKPDPGTRRIQIPPPKVTVVTPADRPPAAVTPVPRDLDRDGPPDPGEIPDGLAELADPVPVAEPPSRGGNAPRYEVFGKTYKVMKSAKGYRETGLASWYGKKFHGRKTSNGEVYDMFKLTAAHKSLPLPTWVRVTNLANGKSVILRVNDRGPFHKGRIIDLSYAAATKLETVGKIATVEIEAITPGEELPPPPRLSVAVAPTAMPERDKLTPRSLQVAAYSDPINAVAMREELSDLGISAVEVRPGTLDNGDAVHRVVVGPFNDRQHMDETRIRIRGAGFEAWPVAE